MDCIFCEKIRAGEVLAQNETAVAFADAFPLSPGHTLIVSRRHEADLFALSAVEQDALWALLRDIRNRIEQSHHPDGYNIGVNVGAAGGQTVGHACSSSSSCSPHHRRRVVHFNMTERPTAHWTAPAEAFPNDTAPAYLLRDRDPVYGERFRRRVRGPRHR